MAWFKRAKEGLKTQKKKELPELWIKCGGCGVILYKTELEKNFHVCDKCDFHFRINSSDYVANLLDNQEFEEFNASLSSVDFLKFKAQKKYTDQLKAAVKKTGSMDAIRTGFGQIHNHPVVLCVMDFSFLGGSMGSVVGEKIARATDRAIERRIPLIILSATGGARMMEGVISLMQMAKTSARLAKLSDEGILYISVLTDPTTAGVLASYAMLGDVILAEPGALIGFTGPRVIKQTIGQELPDGFQKSEFQLKHGFVDAVVSRHELKARLKIVLDFAMGVAEDPSSKNGELNAKAKRSLSDSSPAEAESIDDTTLN